MEKLFSLYDNLHRAGIFLFSRPLLFSATGTKSAVVEVSGTYGIFLDVNRIESTAEEAEIIAHESGHIATGSTHALCSPYDLVEKHESHANRWAYKKLVPKDELDTAVADGYTEPWALAEYFNVTEPFIIAAIQYYKTLGIA